MQSGITASADLHAAFNTFTADPSLFCLPVTITSESLTPAAAPLPFTSSSFDLSLPTLAAHLQPKTPIYLILRPDPAKTHGLVAVTYVPSTAPVRQKMLFASTRNTLTRDLGLEKFGESVFVTDAEEVVDAGQWRSRAVGSNGGGDGVGDEGILTREERELQGVKRAEEEERHGTQGRDLMGSGGSGGRLAVKIEDDAREALKVLGAEGAWVRLGIKLVGGEVLELLGVGEGGVQPGQFLEGVPADRPSYSFYHYPGTEEVVFLYTCPAGSKVRERMVYASARAGVLSVAKAEGVEVTKRLEQGDVGEVGEERLAEEAGVSKGTSSGVAKTGFAKPKRPGRK